MNGYFANTSECKPLTREDLDRAWEQLEAMDRERVPEYQRAPHHPRCEAVRTQDWMDCTCGTGGWLAQYGYFTHRYANAIREAFRRRDAMLGHFEALDSDDD